MFFDVGIVENFGCNLPYVGNTLILYIKSILSGLQYSQVLNILPCLVDENEGIEAGGRRGGRIITMMEGGITVKAGA